jgi:hypothetical protein
MEKEGLSGCNEEPSQRARTRGATNFHGANVGGMILQLWLHEERKMGDAVAQGSPYGRPLRTDRICGPNQGSTSLVLYSNPNPTWHGLCP